MINNKDYTHAREMLERTLGSSEKLGLRVQSAKIHYLLGTSLRLSGKAADAAAQYRETVRLLDEMKKEAGAVSGALKSLSAKDDVMETWRELVALEINDSDDDGEFD